MMVSFRVLSLLFSNVELWIFFRLLHSFASYVTVLCYYFLFVDRYPAPSEKKGIIDSDCMDCECCCEIAEMFSLHIYFSVTREMSIAIDGEHEDVQRCPDGSDGEC
jgi:hypothetical protein